MNRTATVLVNPHARGVARRFDPEAALARLALHGIDAGIHYPGTREESRRLAAAAAARGEDFAFVVGGDGTMRVVAGALGETDTALAALPLGTANVWAREAGIPRDLIAAIDAHATGQTIRIDLGWVNEEPFVLMASIGWDAYIVEKVATGWAKRMMGEGAYVAIGAQKLLGMRPRTIQWTIDDELRDDPMILLVASNTRLYGGRVSFSPFSTAIDGHLDVLSLQPRSPLATMRIARHILNGTVADDPAALHRKTHELLIETPGISIQADGDSIGHTPCTIRVRHASLPVRIPSGVLPGVLTASEA